MCVVIPTDRHPMTARETVIYGRFCNTLSGLVLSDSEILDVLKTTLRRGLDRRPYGKHPEDLMLCKAFQIALSLCCHNISMTWIWSFTGSICHALYGVKNRCLD